uniref:Uncharacterized protein n=1 Tax=Candidatus Kentrum sp. LFY TaxID=2126342 RepID=A0A450WT96_9GAMM|nr:MAG: hypothetical protein BECKLFY1418C_GA0070996_10698 [Candidatus Kentron sp. LFY]
MSTQIPEYLIRRPKEYEDGEFHTEFIRIAMNVEEALVEVHAKAGKDYTFLDLFKLAQPFMVEQWKSKKFPLVPLDELIGSE